ncbi:MAG: O-methyltransferase [Lachnospiraceae bacterium]|nr:O-methyltransferase [Lachnospiraceae bacterium]
MIVNERIVSYIHSLERSNGEVCDEIEEFAHQTNVPIIRKEMESFLRVLIEIKKPKRILELGTAIGYSAILMANSMPEDCRITTIENYDKRIPIAKENFKRAGVEDKVELLEGDALKILQKLNVPYDFVFMDAAKAQYPVYLKEIMRLLPVGGILVADNVLQDGELVESRYAVERRNRTIHSRMREYLYEVKNMEELETTIIPIGDGITLSVRKD